MLFSAGLTAHGSSSRLEAGSSDRTSSGLEAGSDLEVRSSVDKVALAAARAHTVVQAFGLKSSRLAAVAPDARALDTLARATGGQFAALGRNVNQAIGECSRTSRPATSWASKDRP